MPLVNFNIKPNSVKLFDEVKGFSSVVGVLGGERFQMKTANGEENNFYVGEFSYCIETNKCKFIDPEDEKRYEIARRSHIPNTEKLEILINRLNPSYVHDWVKIETLNLELITVTSREPGAFIGKGGSNIKELQRRMKLLGINQRLVLKK